MIDFCLCGRLREGCDYHDPKLQPGYSVSPEVPVYDVSGSAFIAGVTNFTMENWYDAQSVFSIQNDDTVILVVHPALRNRMLKCNLLDIAPGGERLQGMLVKMDPMLSLTKGVATSRFEKDGKAIGLLITREH